MNRRKRDKRNGNRTPAEGDKCDSLQQSVLPPRRRVNFLDANIDSPTSVLYKHLENILQFAPDPKMVESACEYWGFALEGLIGCEWGDFVFDMLAVPDSEQYRQRRRDFTKVLHGLECAIEAIALVRSSAFSLSKRGGRTFVCQCVGFGGLNRPYCTIP